MIPSRTTILINRLPRWFVEQARSVDAQARRRQEQWEETRRRNDAEARRATLAFLCTIEVKDSGWDEWRDTVAEFNATVGEKHGLV